MIYLTTESESYRLDRIILSEQNCKSDRYFCNILLFSDNTINYTDNKKSVVESLNSSINQIYNNFY